MAEADGDRTTPGSSVAERLAQAAAQDGARDLSAPELPALLAELAADPGIAARAATLHPDAGEREWQSVQRDAHVDVYLIAWAAASDTGWHDHDTSSGAMRVLEGTVTQERLRWAAGPERQVLVAGEALSFGPDHVHRLTVADGVAVTLHAYSPPLRTMGQYSFDEGGALRRRTITSDESLRAGLFF